MKLAGKLVVFTLLASVHAALGDVQPGPKLQQRKVELVAKPEQVVAPGPVNPPGCTTFSDSALEATKGLLCATQFVARNVTKIICNEWKPECHTTVTEWQLLDPAASGGDQKAYAATAVAACQLLGYTTFGPGTAHMIGAAKKSCWNGQGWQEDNWWTTLVCCK